MDPVQRPPQARVARRTTYSLVNYREAERIVAEYDAVVKRAEAVFARLPASKRDAFYELVLFPARASPT